MNISIETKSMKHPEGTLDGSIDLLKETEENFLGVLTCV